VGELKNADEFLPSRFDSTADSIRKFIALANALQGHLETLTSVNSAHEIPSEITEGLKRSRLGIAEHTNAPIGGAALGRYFYDKHNGDVEAADKAIKEYKGIK
jgi:hypothetical protein